MKIKNARFLYSIIISALLISATGIFDAQTDITSAFKNANHKLLSKFFNKNIELVLPGHENIYSKAQAEVILKDFFKKYPVKSFSVQHSGGPDDAKYSICLYKAEKTSFRIYYLLKKNGSESYIHLLRIEKSK